MHSKFARCAALVAFVLFQHRQDEAAPEFANRLGSLIEAVNKLGSLFYGTILAIFLLAFYTKRVSGTAAFFGALIGEGAVVWCAIATDMAWLWWNVIGCVVGVGAALVVQRFVPEQTGAGGREPGVGAPEAG